jgi:hypothetical protein
LLLLAAVAVVEAQMVEVVAGVVDFVQELHSLYRMVNNLQLLLALVVQVRLLEVPAQMVEILHLAP